MPRPKKVQVAASKAKKESATPVKVGFDNNNHNTIIISSGTVPRIVKDARFRAGRTLIQKGQDSAVDIFASLLEEARTTFGIDHIETCPVYYEYGNALFRVANRKKIELEQQQQQQENVNNKEKDLPKIISNNEDNKNNNKNNNDFKNQMREAAAAAAVRRMQQQQQQQQQINQNQQIKQEKRENDDDNNDKKPAAIDTVKTVDQSKTVENNNTSNDSGPECNNDNDNEDSSSSSIMDDMQLSLEMMEIAYAIIEEYQREYNNQNDDYNSNSNETVKSIPYFTWIQEQIPRILTGIGDVLSCLNRHPDAVDVYLRALQFRQDILEQQFTSTDSDNKQKQSIEYLKYRRLIVESNILIAEELLSCAPYNQDVITTETKTILVRASDGIIDYARGYYDKARDELQETVLLMGQLAASGIVNIDQEKQDICFVSTMVMGVGVALAQIDEEQQQQQDNAIEPTKKKSKTSK